MPYGTDDIAFTLGRTQPPHQAHFKMLMTALLSLKEQGQLIQFIGSTNVPLKFAKHEKNILSFEERAAMLTAGLIAEIIELHAQAPELVPAKFADRILHNKPVLLPHEFICIPLPDFSDPQRLMGTQDEETRTLAMDQVTEAGLPQHDTFSQLMQDIIAQHPAMKHISISPYSHSYLGWAVNLRNVLNEKVEAYRREYHVDRPVVRYQCCGKDMGTLQYILLIATIIAFFEHHYDFELAFIPVEMLNANISVNATDIRDAFVDILLDPGYSAEKIEYCMTHPDALVQKYPVLAHMRPEARVTMLKAMIALKNQ